MKPMPRNRVPPSETELELECIRWNEKNPVGTRVMVRQDNGVKCLTKTRTPAQVLNGHSAVIWTEDLPGCYLLSRVIVVQPEKI